MEESKEIIGVGIKIPKALIAKYPDIRAKWIQHFAKYYIQYPTVGLDETTTLMKDDKPHYHIHFITTRTAESVKKRREKFAVKVGRCMTCYTSKKPLTSRADICEWLGYAIKDTYIETADGTKDKPLYNEFDPPILKEDLEPFALAAKRKKENLNYKSEKELKEKETKKSKEDEILEYLGKHIFSVETIDVIYEKLIEYQIDNDVYMENFRMQRMAHKFIQKNRQNLGLTNYDIIRFRKL